MPCNATSQLTNAPSVPLQVTMPTNNAQWAVFVQRLQDAINATRDAANRQPVNVVPADFAVYNGSALPALSIIGATSALDTTKHQFGAASLKLTATASTVTVEFSANPIILPPNSRWIESVYIQSSRTSIAGTLAIDTPSASHPVDISGTLLPGTWGRLYGDCDLTADFSTTATMALTFTGCAVGDTFNLEGWQIEAGTGSLPSPFVNTTVPQTYVDTVANAVQALANANAAQSSANTANAQLANIASDNILSPAEKPTVERDYSVITTEQAGIDAQAHAYLQVGSSQQVAYDNAITALTTYLNGLTTPTAWNDKSGNTTIVGPTFRANFNAVYTARQALLDQIYNVAQSLASASGDNLLFNPSFQLNASGTPANASLATGAAFTDGWYVYSQSGGINTQMRVASGSTPYLFWIMNNGVVIPANSGYSIFSRVVSRPIAVNAGDVLTIGGMAYGQVDPGLSMLSRVGLYVHSATGTTEVTGHDQSSFNGLQASTPYVYTVPANVSFVQLELAFFVANNTASPITTTNFNTQGAFLSAWVTRNDLRVAGSGTQIGDQRNLTPVTFTGGRSVLSTSPITYTISGTTVSFSVAAFSLYAGSVTVNYNAASVTHPQPAGTTYQYWLFYEDETLAGGSQTLYATVVPQTLAQSNNVVLVGTCSVTVNAGGGGTPGTGSGGGGLCVADDMFIGEARRAGDAEIGDPFDCIDLPTAAGKHVRALQGVTRGSEECVRMITSNGCALVCSVSTPFDLPDGRNTTAPHMLGEQVITDLGTATVTSLALVGLRPVTRAHLGGVSYAAGADPARRIYSHNAGTSGNLKP